MYKKKIKGTLFVVSAPSGTGKTTLCKKLIKRFPSLYFSISYTTRFPRDGEIQDKDYTFISKREFQKMVNKGEFVEWTEIHGEFYGTSKKRLEGLLKKGVDVLMDIDIKGMINIKEKYRDGVYIFILPPSIKVLRERLEKRKTDSKEEIKVRLRQAISEIKKYYIYDYVIINDKIENAFKQLEAIIISHSVSTKVINPRWIEERFLKGRR